MPTWDEVLNEIGSIPNVLDITRRKYVKELSDYTGRNTIIYYSGFLQKQPLMQQGVDFGINDNDKNGFMTVVNKLDRDKGLDLILHTPGGNISATESIVFYLKSLFGNDIRAIVPQIAMSAGTMIACACKSIAMGKQSNLGPIDPQFGYYPAHGLLEEFERIMKDVKEDPTRIHVWREVLAKYHPTLIGECEKAVKWSESMVSDWLKTNMFEEDPDRETIVADIIQYLGSHAMTLSHSRHLHMPDLMDLGLKIESLEADQELQDKVLSVHHSAVISIAQTKAVKIIENNIGKAYIQTA